MEPTTGLEQCLTFINCQLKPAETPGRARRARKQKLAVTLSRQTGSGALIVAEQLAACLQARAPAEPGWTVFDRNLVEKVLEDHNLPKKLAQFMPEDRVSEIDDMMQELLGLHPPSWTLVRQTTESILKLAELGNVVIVGRGAHVITAKLEHVFHVRLVGSLEKRVERVQEHLRLGPKAAREFVEQRDRGRRRYLRKHFHADTEDPLLYHLILNTDWIPLPDAAEIIADAVMRWREG